MPGSVITVTSGKGGVGKTTTSANLAVALALAGKRVIDARGLVVAPGAYALQTATTAHSGALPTAGPADDPPAEQRYSR